VLRLIISAAIYFTSKDALMASVNNFIYLVGKKKFKNADESTSKRTVAWQYLVRKVTMQ
jgi:hypothetical protein